MKHEVVEMCPSCGNEIVMDWDVSERGYKAFCPVCGGRLMLCDECCHEATPDNPDGECVVNCDWCEDGCCRRNPEHKLSERD